jgi:hypothetical protein
MMHETDFDTAYGQRRPTGLFLAALIGIISWSVLIAIAVQLLA